MNGTIKVLCYKSKTLSNGEHRRIVKNLCLQLYHPVVADSCARYVDIFLLCLYFG